MPNALLTNKSKPFLQLISDKVKTYRDCTQAHLPAHGLVGLWSHAFLRLTPVASFPTLRAGRKFSRAVFVLVAGFPAIDTGCCYLEPLVLCVSFTFVDSLMFVSRQLSTVIARFSDEEASTRIQRLQTIHVSKVSGFSIAIFVVYMYVWSQIEAVF